MRQYFIELQNVANQRVTIRQKMENNTVYLTDHQFSRIKEVLQGSIVSCRCTNPPIDDVKCYYDGKEIREIFPPAPEPEESEGSEQK